MSASTEGSSASSVRVSGPKTGSSTADVTAGIILVVAVGTGYTLIGEVRDPFAPGLIPIAVLLGMGEVSVIVTGGALLGQEAPLENRGPIIGFYNAVGGVGILFATYIGGLVFDGIGRTAPFTLMGLMNFLLLGAALTVRWRHPQPVQRTLPATAATGSGKED